MQNLDYAPLKNIKAEGGAGLGGHSLTDILIYIGIPLFVSVSFSRKLFVIALPIAIVILVAILYSHRKNQKSAKDAWQEFATLNKLKIEPVDKGSSLIPQCLELFGGKQYSQAVSINIGSATADLFWLHYEIPGSKDDTVRQFTIASIAIPYQVPNLLINSVKCAYQFDNSKLPQKIKLEGDFNKYFTVMAAPVQQIEDLQILTPDVMELLVDEDFLYNIQLANGHIYVIASNDLRWQDQLDPFIKSVNKLQIQIARNLH